MAKEVENKTLNFFVMGIREFLGSFTDSKDPNWGRIVISIFLLFIAFLFVGVEALKVVFRRNFSKGEVHMTLIILASIAFFCWGWLCFYQEGIEDNLSSGNNLIVAGWLYFAVGFIVLTRGAYEWNKSNKGDTGTTIGESILLGFLKNLWWNEYRLKMFAEPLAVFAVALPLTAINFYLGIPLVFCGVSQVIFNIILAIRQIEETPDNLNVDRNNVGNKNTVR